MKSGKPPRLYVIADLDFAGGVQALGRYVLTLAEVARRFDSQLAIQVRAKNAAATDLEGIARSARLSVGQEALLILNGPEQLAIDLGYDGVHWPESAIPEKPPVAGTSPAFRSAAVHSLGAVRRAERGRATALVYGPVFRPTWKTAVATGLNGLANIARTTQLPVYALGGINPARIADCLAVGAHGIAVLSGLAEAKDVIATCREYLAQTNRDSKPPPNQPILPS